MGGALSCHRSSGVVHNAHIQSTKGGSSGSRGSLNTSGFAKNGGQDSVLDLLREVSMDLAGTNAIGNEQLLAWRQTLRQNLYNDVESLQNMDSDDWNAMGLPRRLFKLIQMTSQQRGTKGGQRHAVVEENGEEEETPAQQESENEVMRLRQASTSEEEQDSSGEQVLSTQQHLSGTSYHSRGGGAEVRPTASPKGAWLETKDGESAGGRWSTNHNTHDEDHDAGNHTPVQSWTEGNKEEGQHGGMLEYNEADDLFAQLKEKEAQAMAEAAAAGGHDSEGGGHNTHAKQDSPLPGGVQHASEEQGSGGAMEQQQAQQQQVVEVGQQGKQGKQQQQQGEDGDDGNGDSGREHSMFTRTHLDSQSVRASWEVGQDMSSSGGGGGGGGGGGIRAVRSASSLSLSPQRSSGKLRSMALEGLSDGIRVFVDGVQLVAEAGTASAHPTHGALGHLGADTDAAQVYTGRSKQEPSDELLDLMHDNKVHTANLARCDLEAGSVGSLVDNALFNTSLRSLDLQSNHRLGTKGTAQVFGMLQRVSTLEELDVAGCGVDDESVRVLADVLKDNHTLRVLSLRRNKTMSQEAMADLAAGLAANAGLRSLDLEAVGLNAISVSSVCKALSSNNSLTELNLAMNRLESQGVGAVAWGLSHNKSLRKLNLDGTAMGSNGAPALSEAMCENTSVEWLSLQKNVLRDEGTMSIFQMLTINSTVTHMDLTYNGITSEGVAMLADTLKINKSLQSLVLDRNSIRANGAEYLMDALRVNNTLRKLSVKKCDLKAAGLQFVAEAVKVSRSLELLDLSCNAGGDEGILAVFDALRTNVSLTHLNVENNDNKIDLMTHTRVLHDILAQNSTLNELVLRL